MDEVVLIKQEVLIGDERVEEEVGSTTRMIEDEVTGYSMIKQEELIEDERIEEEVENSWSAEDDVREFLMIKQELEDNSTADPLGDGSEILLGSVGVQRGSD
ncbi:hypothetical protein GE061_011529 [Apolygus lucorum]|uniref:Uncharacterized protein n=1 Tax=Apolygus lucorum TaxID=248454 RepID=A0A8S9XY33_APOLU|nr:hypothetical protein GE061_011529 [Apolygus lucorum]